jgi:hypothetical protein
VLGEIEDSRNAVGLGRSSVELSQAWSPTLASGVMVFGGCDFFCGRTYSGDVVGIRSVVRPTPGTRLLAPNAVPERPCGGGQ